MMKRGTSAIAFALVALLAFAGTAAAQSDPLRYKTAKKLAVKLAKKQVGDRDVVSQQLFGADRMSRNAIVWSYADRTTDEVFCTAVLVVRQRRISADGDRRITARFRGQECAKVPDDALAVEAVTRSAVRALRGTEDETIASLRRVTRSLRRCQNFEVPRSRRAHANALIDVAIIRALVGPNDAALGDFVVALEGVDTANQVLRRGIGGWADWLAGVRSLRPINDPCARLRRWARADWSPSVAPIVLGEYRRFNRRSKADSRAIRRAARHLRAVGVFPRLARAFTPDVLLLRIAEVGAGDEARKLQAAKSALR